MTSYSANASQFGVNVHSLDGKTWSDEITVRACVLAISVFSISNS